jgi:DNA-binding MarR family transcriptional regulator
MEARPMTTDTPDFVDRLVAQWESEVPGIDVEGLMVFSRLARIGDLAAQRMGRNLAEYSLNETKFNMLSALRRAGSPYRLPPKELAKAMLLTSGAITYVIDSLEKAGYVARRTQEGDRRMLQIELTPEGKTLIEQAMRKHLELCAEILRPLTPRQRDDLVAGLRRLLLVLDAPAP